MNSVRLDPRDIDRLGPAAQDQIRAALGATDGGPRSDHPPRDDAGAGPEAENAPAGPREGGLPPRSARRLAGPSHPGRLAWLLAAVRARPWPAALVGVVLLAGGALAGVLASEPKIALRSPLVRCDLGGQVALEKTMADCQRLARAEAPDPATPLAAPAAPQATQPREPVPVAAQPSPARTEGQPARAPANTPAPKASQPAPASPVPKQDAQPAQPAQPTQAPPQPAQPQVAVAPNAPDTFCVHLSPQGATTTDGPCGQSQQGQAPGVPPGLRQFLCSVERRTDNFCN